VSWLASLPHQIPFRAASALVRRDEKTIEGLYLCTANDALGLEIMVVEAMAQLGGGLALRSQGFLTGIDRCTVDRMPIAGDVVRIVVALDAEFGGTFRFSGTAAIDGVEIARARFYLASPHAQA